jgi:tape measure domain-containing protein
MANKETKLKFKVGIEGVDKLRGLTSSLKKLNDNSLLSTSSSKKLLVSLQKQKKAATQTISGTRSLSNSYRQLANSVKIGSRQFKVATARAEQLERKLRKLNTTAKKGRSLKGMAQTAGAIAGAGVFGGAEGAIGAGIGGIVGGAPGALVGGAIGAQVGQFTGALAEVAQYDAALEKQRKALRLVIGDTDQYNKAQAFLAKTSKDLAIPQDVIVRQFTSLTASVKGAGLSVDDAKESFLAIASGIRGTGGSLEDMKSAMRATSQVFSKGKVSAEELRQQLGERLPGAFTLFAESMGKTPAELDKALEQGKVTLEDFLGFSQKLFDEYGENAKILAQAPESAGDRLQTEISNLKDNLGDLLRPIGAEFQAVFGEIVGIINSAITAFKQFMGIGLENAIAKAESAVAKAQKNFDRVSGLGDSPRNRNLKAQALNRLSIAQGQLNDLKTEQNRLDEEGIENEDKKLVKSMSTFDSLKAGMQSYVQSISDMNKQIQDATMKAFKGMEDALVNFVMTGKLNFADLTRSILADITRIIIRQSIITPLLGVFGITANAKGNVYDQGLKKFAKGGIVTQPTLFKYGSGGTGNFGLMGEAGAEAILPLKRGRSGNLGVEASGGATNIVVNVDASGSSVEGDEAEGKALGMALSAAIESELIKQKRPGGLLA